MKQLEKIRDTRLADLINVKGQPTNKAEGETVSEKPDGYVAMQDNVMLSFCAKVYASWLDAALSADLDGTIFQPDDVRESLDVVAAKLGDKNWRIRPVKLVFLDEEKNDE